MFFVIGLIVVGVGVAFYLKKSGAAASAVAAVKGAAGRFVGLFKQQ